MAKHSSSSFLDVLAEAATLAAEDSMGDSRGNRGAMGDGATSPARSAEPGSSAADVLVHKLQATDASVQTDIATIQAWLEDHKQLLRLLDDAMQRIFEKAERRIKRNALYQNIFFTFLGGGLGLLIPWALSQAAGWFH